MADKKQAVIDAYVELANSLKTASAAASSYAKALGHASEPAALQGLIANPPGFPFVAGAEVEGKEGKKGKAKKEKKYKDPNAPKRPASAYLEFQNAVRKQFRDADPGLPYAEVLRKISDTWAHMDPKDKEHWNEITAAKTAEYEVAKAAYTPVDADGNELPAVTPKGKKSAEVHIGKDGKEYTGKKRGRKSNAEKLALAAEEAGGEGVLDQIAQAVDAAPKKEKKATKAKAASPAAKPSSSKKVVKPASPDASSDEEDSDGSSSEPSSSEDGSDDDSDEEEEDSPAPVPVKSSKSNGKSSSSSKKEAASSKSEKPKSKKARTA